METKSSISDHQLLSRRFITPADETFPEEIITEILSRLPVKTLLKFRCVSKSWRSLISSNHFIKSHLQISRKDTNFTRHKIMATIRHPNFSIKQCSLPSLFSGLVEDNAASFFDFPLSNVCVVGSCNGLVCLLYNGEHIYLWNPSMRNYKKLPDVEDSMKKSLFITHYGFGFDESNEDYKVLVVISGSCNGGTSYETMVKLYSLRTNSWKRIEVFEDGRPIGVTGKFVSGKLHWGKRNIGPSSKWDIVSFDLGSEMCGNVAPPSSVESRDSTSLGVIGGCLSVFTGVHVWVLKEYGMSDSWTKMTTIPPRVGKPLCVGPKGEILLVHASSFVIYSPNDNGFRRPEIRNFGPFFEAHVYCESLVSLADGFVSLADGEPEKKKETK